MLYRGDNNVDNDFVKIMFMMIMINDDNENLLRREVMLFQGDNNGDNYEYDDHLHMKMKIK